MNHSFDIEIAAKYGVIEAVVYENIRHWLRANLANGANIRDGRPWTYNSVKAYGRLFPYLTLKQTRRALDSLVDKGALIKGEYNKANYDKTSWYSIPDISTLAIRPFGQMDLTKRANRIDQKGKPIPDINTDVKPDTGGGYFGPSMKKPSEPKKPKVKPDLSTIEPVLQVLRESDKYADKGISLNDKRLIEHEIERAGMDFVVNAVRGKIITEKARGKKYSLSTFFDPDKAGWRAEMAAVGEAAQNAAEGLKMASQGKSDANLTDADYDYIHKLMSTGT